MGPRVLFVTLAVLAVLAALPLGKGAGHREEEGARGAAAVAEAEWPCCDHCGLCTRSFPPLCQCWDKSPSGCHPNCQNCVPVPSIADLGFVYQCMDVVINFCERRCTPDDGAAAVAA